MRTRVRALPPLLAAVALTTACVVAPARSPLSSGQPIPETPRPTPTPERGLVFAGAVPVAPDRELAAQCWGSGTPTILLEGGGTRSNISGWGIPFVMNLAAANTVCLYSRAGGEGSTPPDGLLTYEMIISDAFTLLDWLRDEHGVSPPYVFVGWSFGGHVALAEALDRPGETAGIVILDNDPPASADFMTVCTGSGRTEADCQAEFEGDLEAQQLGADIRAQITALPGVPAAIVSAMSWPDCRLEPGESSVSYNMNGEDLIAPDCQQLANLIADTHAQGWVEILPQMTQTRVNASHDELINQAGAEVAEVIRGVIARAGLPTDAASAFAGAVPSPLDRSDSRASSY